MGKRDKQAKYAVEPEPVKKAKFSEPGFDDGHPLAWRFSGSDRGGPFRWMIPDDAKFRDVIEKLYEFEGKNWNEITRGGSHTIAVSDLCDAAKKRLEEIKRDDLDELLSLRLTGPNRVWCIKDGHIMRVLWWDAEHQVYPTPIDKNDREKIRNRK